MQAYAFRSLSFLTLTCLFLGCIEPVVINRDESINVVHFDYSGDLQGSFNMTGEFLRDIGGEGVDGRVSGDKREITVFAIKHLNQGNADVLEMTLRSPNPITQGQDFVYDPTPDSSNQPLDLKVIFDALYVGTQFEDYYVTLDAQAKVQLLTEDSVFGTFKGHLFNGKHQKFLTIDSGYFAAKLSAGSRS
jgi:hypothetical protein